MTPLPSGAIHPPAVDLAELLDQTAWAQGLSWDQCRLIAGFMSHRHAEVGETIVREGDRDASISVVAEGTLEVVKQAANGEARVIATLRRGATLGEMSLLDGEARSASVVARTDAELLVLSGQALNRLTREKPLLGVEIYKRLGRMVSRHLRQTSGRLVETLGG
jgi:CRP-like cAMP-binding protein